MFDYKPPVTSELLKPFENGEMSPTSTGTVISRQLARFKALSRSEFVTTTTHRSSRASLPFDVSEKEQNMRFESAITPFPLVRPQAHR